ncbi:hypothetical protein ID866_11838, partial [Astraeus odoratus]
MAQGIDACYWECKSEIAHQAKTNPQSSSSSKQSLSGGSSSKQSNPSSSTSSSSSAGKGKNPQVNARPGDRIDSDHAPTEVRLNMSTLSDPDSLKPIVYIPDYDVSDVIALLDSGSSHC